MEIRRGRIQRPLQIEARTPRRVRPAGVEAKLVCSGEKCKVDAEIGLLDCQKTFFINLFLFKVSWSETKQFSELLGKDVSYKTPTWKFKNPLVSLLD